VRKKEKEEGEWVREGGRGGCDGRVFNHYRGGDGEQRSKRLRGWAYFLPFPRVLFFNLLFI
jgi:hypothetical protein